MSAAADLALLASAPRIDVFVGQTRSASLVQRLALLGFGEMTVRGEWPPRRHPYAYDNGCFKDWRARGDFDASTFEFELRRMSISPRPLPSFVVVPDAVGDGAKTLSLFREWLPRLRVIFHHRAPPPFALAVQDGMVAADVRPLLRDRSVRVLFVGGTTAWKWSTAESWVELAHAHGARCHIGRVGTPRLVAQARRIMADSIDSAYPLWCTEHLDAFTAAVLDREPRAQLPLLGVE